MTTVERAIEAGYPRHYLEAMDPESALDTALTYLQGIGAIQSPKPRATRKARRHGHGEAGCECGNWTGLGSICFGRD